VNEFKQIRKRDGRLVPFDDIKITDAIFQAAKAEGGNDRSLAEELTKEVLVKLGRKI